MNEFGEDPSKWQAPGLVCEALRNLRARAGGQGLRTLDEIVKGGFRDTGLFPVDPDMADRLEHLYPRSEAFFQPRRAVAVGDGSGGSSSSSSSSTDTTTTTTTTTVTTTVTTTTTTATATTTNNNNNNNSSNSSSSGAVSDGGDGAGGGARAGRAGGAGGGVVLAPVAPEATGAVVLLDRGVDGLPYKVGTADLLPPSMQFHLKDVGPACRVGFVTAVEDSADHRLPLPHKDKDCPKANTLLDWWQHGGAGRPLAWPAELIATPARWEELQVEAAAAANRKRQREEGGGGEGAGGLKRQTIADFLIAQQFTPQEMMEVVEHPEFQKAMCGVGEKVGKCGKLLARAAQVALPLVATLGVPLKSVQQRRQKEGEEGKQGQEGKENEEGDAGEKGKQGQEGNGKARTKLGELKNAPKVLNSVERLDVLKGVVGQEEAQARHCANVDDAYARVNTVLYESRIIKHAALMANKRPSTRSSC